MMGTMTNSNKNEPAPERKIVNGLKELKLVKKTDTENRFTDGEITVITGRWTFYHGMHHMSDPANAKATFICAGKRYQLKNTKRIATVEEWYKNELLPKFREMIGSKCADWNDNRAENTTGPSYEV